MSRRLVIFGCGDIARLAEYYFTTDSDYRVEAFCVDRAYIPAGGKFQDKEVVAFEDLVEKYPPSEFELFIGLSYTKMNRIRERVFNDAKKKNYHLASYVSSHCTYLAPNPPGENAFILEDNTIQPFVSIGANVTLWSGNHIGHDSTIGDHTFISSHVVVSGHCRIGQRCFLGVNATLRNSISIADDTLIGAGVTLMKDSRAGEVYLPPRPHLFDKSSDMVEL